ncbi:HAD-IA family hydrolase [Oceaniglobus trochenteri]|uniref:HAD-IA family hydrolase n=1 Tax=Oceaniglobus trochenteri TaxID=2763260 RepID=UPI001CFFBD90|nr:HAD-IA family hydrolase [Oceaniglobus trochenteri]
MRTVIFDLDGTLADTALDMLAAANACFRALGHGDLLRGETDQGVGLRGGRAMLTLGLSRLGIAPEAGRLDELYPLLLEHYRENIHVHSRFYPGVAEAVQRLRDGGYAVGICTNKPEALAERLMQSMGARDWFGALIGADTLPTRKPDPEPLFEAVRRCGGNIGQAVMIGDTVTDHQTARNARVPSVLVGFGPGADKARALMPDAMLEHYDDLDGVVASLIG